jgi:AcrR family transcriptional regulator
MDPPHKPSAGRRGYRMGARAAAAEATRQRILDAATQLFEQAPYEEVLLEQIAERAQVALKTVLRRFQTKETLLLACGRNFAALERQARAVPAGDIAQAAHVLGKRYEESMDFVIRYIAVEGRVAAVAALLMAARKGHWKWLEQVFAPYLPEARGALHRQRVAELFAATEIYNWHSWRRQLGLGRELAERALRELLEAVVAGWSARDAAAQEGD